PLSFAQQRLWFIDQLEPGTPTYNLPVALRMEGALDAAALERAFTELVRRHESLRTTFVDVNGKAAQVITPPAPCAVGRWSASPPRLPPSARSRSSAWPPRSPAARSTWAPAPCCAYVSSRSPRTTTCCW
ncbi:condensation domain-containing protein, partial [Pyxidicoccus sp. 3LG]